MLFGTVSGLRVAVSSLMIVPLLISSQWRSLSTWPDTPVSSLKCCLKIKLEPSCQSASETEIRWEWVLEPFGWSIWPFAGFQCQGFLAYSSSRACFHGNVALRERLSLLRGWPRIPKHTLPHRIKILLHGTIPWAHAFLITVVKGRGRKGYLLLWKRWPNTEVRQACPCHS